MLCLGIVTHLPDSTMGDRKCRDKVASMENLLSQLPSEHVPLGGGPSSTSNSPHPRLSSTPSDSPRVLHFREWHHRPNTQAFHSSSVSSSSLHPVLGPLFRRVGLSRAISQARSLLSIFLGQTLLLTSIIDMATGEDIYSLVSFKQVTVHICFPSYLGL